MTEIESPIRFTLRDVAPCQKELSVEVSAQLVEAEFEEVYRQIKKAAQVPGFRPGFAPRDLLERYYGAKAREEVTKRLVRRSMAEVVRGHPQLDIVTQPEVSKLQCEPKKPMTYLAQVEVAPLVPLSRYKRLVLHCPEVGVTEKQVKEVLVHLQEAHAELVPVLEPRAAQEGDFLLVDVVDPVTPGSSARRDLVIHLKGKEGKEGEEGKEGREGINPLRDLVGMKPGENRTIQVPPAPGSERKGELTLTVSLKQIKKKEAVPVDDAFAKTVGPYDSLSALKEAIRKDLEAQALSSQKQHLEQEAMGQLLAEWNLDVPPSLVTSQAKRLMKERTLELISQGVHLPDLEKNSQILIDRVKLDALRAVKLFFILRRIASTEGITAAEEEMSGKLEVLAKRAGTSLEELKKDLESKDLLEELAWSIIRGKVVDLILKEAEIEEKRS